MRKRDPIIAIFVGAASEFAPSRVVDLLYCIGKLTDDPLGPLFSDHINCNRPLK